jgi:predicted anti-sigma-YlaC factor YlaD
MSVFHNIRMILSLSCDESSRLLSDDLDRTLSRAERMAVRLHLVFCHRCRKFGRNLHFFRNLLRRMTEQCLSGEEFIPRLSPDERVRILEAVTRAQSQE